MRVAVCVFVVLIVGAFAVERVPFSSLDEKVQFIARRHLREAAHLVDGAWDGADMLWAIPLFRDGVSGPAYYEVQVSKDGKAAGVMHVATGSHDHPVSFFSENGESAFSDVLLAAPTLKLTRKLLTAKAPLELSATQRSAIDADWATVDTELIQTKAGGVGSGSLDTVSSPPSLSNRRCVRMPGGDANFPRFNQYTVDGCATGCGPTALAMLFTWGAALGKEGVNPWRSCFGSSSIPTGGSTSSAGVEAMTKDLGRRVGTFCVPGGGGNAATAPYNPVGKDMSSAKSYLSDKGSSARLVSDGSVLGRSAYASNAIRGIDAGSAVILGVGPYPTGAHYILVSCHGTSGGKNWWRANMGWGGSSNGWLYSDPWYAGYLTCAAGAGQVIRDVVG